MAAQTITEATATELINNINKLNTSIAVFENRLSDYSKDLDHQRTVNNDIETRMKQREIEAAKQKKDIDLQAKWQERATGAMITIAVALIITIITIVIKGNP